METNDRRFDWVAEYLDQLAYVIRGAAADFFELIRLCPRYAVAQTRRGRPNVIQDFFGPRVQEAFGNIPHKVRIDSEYDTPQIFFMEPGVRMKFNKADADYRIHPPNTARAYSFVDNAPCLPGFEAPLADYSLLGVYGLDSTGTRLVRASITCQHDGQVIWRNELPELPADHRWAIIRPSSPQTGPAIIDISERRAESE